MEEQHTKQENQVSSRTIIGDIATYFKRLFNIRKGLDWVGTVTSIRSKVSLEGENVWMLICAIMVASVGLNLNSGAVIIGAMLISPLMSPILGIGLGIGINDRDLLWKAVKSFAVATLFSILTSYFYFKFLTPLKEPGSEIISRTTPTILDAIVAVFGGTAGIVAVSRKEKGAAIPGVAIATALLPPLAVSGYGLAVNNWTFFTHSFYLFFLNSMLIALATYFVVRFLGFPLKEHQTKEGKKKATIAITTFVIALLVPGFLILNQLLKERERKQASEEFLISKFDTGTNQIFGNLIRETSTTQDTVFYTVSYRGNEIDSTTVANYESELTAINNKVCILDPTLLNLSKAQLAKLDSKNSQMSKELQEQNKKEAYYQQQLTVLQAQIDSLQIPEKNYAVLEQEIPALWPEVEHFYFGSTRMKNKVDSLDKSLNTLIVKWDDSLASRQKNQQKQQLQRYLNSKFTEQNVLLIEEE